MTVSKIWVFAEASEGKVTTATLEILTKARELADTVEVVTAYGADVAAVAGEYGATKVFNVPGTEGKLLGAPIAAAVASAIEAGTGPDAILLATSYTGRDVAGRLSVKVDAPVITNVVDLVERDGHLAGVEPIFGGATEVLTKFTTDKVGIFRTGADLQAAVTELQALLERSRHIGLRSPQPGPNPELVTAYRTQKMLKLALCVAHGALQRTESRGAHFREDHPRRDDLQWLKRTLATWKDPQDTLPTLQYEPLDIGRMELPPGWRGYGAKDYVDHPDTAARAAEVAALRERMAGAGRHELQRALMPYDELLPDSLRGLNERIDEPLQKSA